MIIENYDLKEDVDWEIEKNILKYLEHVEIMEEMKNGGGAMS